MASELDFIAGLRDLATSPAARGLNDDAAVLEIGGETLVLTQDTLIDGVHVIDGSDPADIAWKLVAVNLSDLAAKGALPSSYVLGASFGPSVEDSWIEAFAGGLAADQAQFGVSLLGGDTVRTPGPSTFSLTAFGDVARGGFVTRGGAKPGDGLYVTGTIGDAHLGLRVLTGEIDGLALGLRERLVTAYRLPSPRTAFGPFLPRFAHAAADVSDGLTADIGHICEVSGVGADIELARVPLSSSADRVVKKDDAAKLALLSGGDDYEIVFTAPADAADAIAQASGEADTAVTRIGHIVEGRAGEVRVLSADGQAMALSAKGYTHF